MFIGLGDGQRTPDSKTLKQLMWPSATTGHHPQSQHHQNRHRHHQGPATSLYCDRVIGRRRFYGIAVSVFADNFSPVRILEHRDGIVTAAIANVMSQENASSRAYCTKAKGRSAQTKDRFYGSILVFSFSHLLSK